MSHDPREGRDATRRRSAAVHRWLIARPHRKPTHLLVTGVLILVGLGCTALAILTQLHPFLYVSFGAGQTGTVPDMLGGLVLLVVPFGLLGIGAYRLWWALALDIEAWKQERRRRERAGGQQTVHRSDAGTESGRYGSRRRV